VPPLGQGDALEALYREVVLEHYRRPRHREPLAAPDGAATAHNPVCGDQARVEVCLEGERVRDVSARVRGCSIAVASGSVMAELVLDRPAGAGAELKKQLEAIVAGEPAGPELDPRLRAFAGVAPMRSRHRCALLAWEAFEAALARAGGPAAPPPP
jgi:nitrogen fixation NifU-like protein